MIKIQLTFEIEDSEYNKLIPCVGIYAVIHTATGIVEVVNDAPGEGIGAKGTNAVLTAYGVPA